MNKFAFAALLLCTAGAADAAMTLNPRGTGQVLLYPAYTTLADQSTLVTLVNTGDRAKAVRLTFREGWLGRDVLALNVFLGPHDGWNATVFQIWSLSRDPGVVSNDRSCVAPVNVGGTPQLPDGRRYLQFAQALPFIPLSLPGYRPEQGSIEAIEIGEIKAGSALANAVTAASGAAPTCTGVENADLSASLDAPGGKLYGAFSIVNAGAGTILSGNATAIDGFSVTSLGGLPTVDLAQGRTSANAGDPVEAHVDVDGHRVVVKYSRDRAVDAVSALLMADTLTGEFVTDPNAGAKTDWVLAMPTRHFYHDATATGALNPREPFLIRSHGTPYGCSYYLADVRDRDQRAIAPRETYLMAVTPSRGVQPTFLPGPFPPRRAARALCNESDSIAFSRYVDVPPPAENFRSSGVMHYGQTFELVDASAGLDGGIAQLRLGMPDPNGEAGSATTPSVLPAGVEGPALRGLPVIGFEATLYVNGTINYTSAVPLRSGAACATNAGAVVACP